MFYTVFQNVVWMLMKWLGFSDPSITTKEKEYMQALRQSLDATIRQRTYLEFIGAFLYLNHYITKNTKSVDIMMRIDRNVTSIREATYDYIKSQKGNKE